MQDIQETLLSSSDTHQKKALEIFLVHSEKESHECALWFGVYRKGVLSPNQLLDIKRTEDILTTSAVQGIACDSTLVLADAREAEAPCMYFLSPIEDEKLADSALWIENVSEAISKWGSESPGIYFAPELLGTELASKLLSGLMKSLIQKQKFSKLYLLVGAHGMYSLLNTVLRLKAKLHENSEHQILIYH